MCLQEIKYKEIKYKENFKLWSSNEVEWIENANENNVGGVITMWRRNCFLLSKVTNGNKYNIIEREWRLGEAIQIVVVNMYNSSSLLEKRVVWEEVREKRRMINTKVWFVVRDFNSIRRPMRGGTLVVKVTTEGR